MTAHAFYVEQEGVRTPVLDAALSMDNNEPSCVNNLDTTEPPEEGTPTAINEYKLFEHIAQDVLRQLANSSSEETGMRGGSIEVTIESEIPLAAGMGSSAAWGASFSSALLHSLNFISSHDS